MNENTCRVCNRDLAPNPYYADLIKTLVATLQPLARQRLSTEPGRSTLVAYTPAQELRNRAAEIEADDQAILAAREAIARAQATGDA